MKEYPAHIPRPLDSSLLAVIALVFATVFFLQAAQIHQVFGTSAYDLGIFVQNFWLLSTLNDPFNTVRGLHAFGDHFQPFQILLTPLYRLLPSPLTLFLVQVFAVTWSAFVLHRIASKRLGRYGWVVLGITLGFLINPLVHNPLLWHYHALVLAMPLFMLWLESYLDGKETKFLLLLFLLLLVREDVSLTTLSFGLVIICQRRWKLGITTVLLSLGWWLLVSRVAMPLFNGEGYFRHEGYTVGILLERLFDPKFYIQLFLESSEAWMYLAYTFLPLLLIPLRAPLWLFPAIPSLLANILIGGYNTQIAYHYSVYAVPFLYLATIQGAHKILNSRPRLSPLMAAGILISSAWAAAEGSRLSPSKAYMHWQSWKGLGEMRERVSHYDQELGSSVGISASDFLLPHLANRSQIYLFPNPWKLHYWGIRGEGRHHPNQVDYIFINPGQYWHHYRLLQYLQENGFFILEFQDRRLMILRRIKREPADRATAVNAPIQFSQSILGRVAMGKPLLSVAYPYPEGGFSAPPFTPSNGPPPEGWQPASPELDGLLKLDLQNSTSPIAFGARYVYLPLQSKAAQEVEISIGSDDTLEVWFEGKKLLEHVTPRPANLGDNHLIVRMKPGVNHLYFRVDNRGGAWRLIAQIKPVEAR